MIMGSTSPEYRCGRCLRRKSRRQLPYKTVCVLTVCVLHGLLLVAGEDIQVIEAVSENEKHVDSNYPEREKYEPKPDQLALESAPNNHNNHNGHSQEKHQINFPFKHQNPQRGHIPLPPVRGSSSHVGLSPPHPAGKPLGVAHHGKPFPVFEHDVEYNGPPPPLPPNKQVAMDKYGGEELWPAPVPDMPKVISLDVKCEKNLMKVYVRFDKPFYGIVFSKGYYSNINCIHLPAGLGRTSANFDVSIHACGTTGNTENGLYGYGSESGSGTYFENTIVIQYDPQVQEVWDQARKLRCTWHDQYEKSVTFRPFPVDMLDIVRADFAGDNVGCWMQIQVGKGPWASEVSGLVKIGQTMTMVLAIKDDDSKFDMLVRNCMAHDGKRAPIQLVDQKGCVTRPKLMSRFTKIKNFGASASVLSYAHFQAFKFPDSMEVHFQCTIQICRYQCPDQCEEQSNLIQGSSDIHQPPGGTPESVYGPPPHLPIDAFLHAAAGQPRDERRVRRQREVSVDPEKEVGVNRIIRVVSSGDLTFSLNENGKSNAPTMVFPVREESNQMGVICMTTPGFAATLMVLLAILVVSCLMSAFLWFRLRPFSTKKPISYTSSSAKNKKSTFKNCFS